MTISKREKRRAVIEDKELLRLLKALTECGLSITIKGAMLLNVILDGDKLPLRRGTRDIDFDIDADVELGSSEISSEELRALIQSKLSSVGYVYDFDIIRPYKPGSSGLNLGVVTRQSGQEVLIASMDINVGRNKYQVKYNTAYGFDFYGQSMARIFADKVKVASQRKILWRYKDLYDLTLLGKYSGWSAKITDDIIEDTGGELEDFSTFDKRADDLYSAHTAFVRDYGLSTDMNVIYETVKSLIEPFRKPQSEELIWDGSKWVRRSQYRGPLMLKTENFARQSSGFGTLHLQ